MISQNQLSKEKVTEWFKKYMYAIIGGIMLLVLATTTTVVLLTSSPQEKVGTGSQKLSFYTPVLNFTVGQDYVEDSLVYNATLNQWEAHKSVDLKVAEGSNVYACLDGEVTSVEEDYLNGTSIEITHDNGLVTKYSSLGEEVNVKEGDQVKSGQKIGIADNNAGNSDLGTHLRLEVFVDGEAVDPNLYLELSGK